MYNGFARLKVRAVDQKSNRRYKPNQINDLLSDTLQQRQLMLSTQAELRRQRFVSNIPEQAKEQLRESFEQTTGAQLSKYQFRERNREKEIDVQGFKISNYESTKERTERIIKQNKDAILFEKFKVTDFLQQLRTQNKTMRNRIGMRSKAASESERINDIISKKPKFDREPFNMDLMVSANVFRDDSFKMNSSMKRKRNNVEPLHKSVNQSFIKVENYLKPSSPKNNDQNQQLNNEPYYKLNFPESLTARTSSPIKKGHAMLSKSVVINKPKRSSHHQPVIEQPVSNRQYEHFEKLIDFTKGVQDSNSPYYAPNFYQSFKTNLKMSPATIHLKKDIVHSPVSPPMTIELVSPTFQNKASRQKLEASKLKQEVAKQQQTPRESQQVFKKYSPRKEQVIYESSTFNETVISNDDKMKPVEFQRMISNVSDTNNVLKAKIKKMFQDKWQKYIHDVTDNYLDKHKIYPQSLQEQPFKSKHQRVQSVIFIKDRSMNSFDNTQ